MLSDLRTFLSKRQREHRRQERIRALQEQSAAEMAEYDLKLQLTKRQTKGGAHQ